MSGRINRAAHLPRVVGVRKKYGFTLRKKRGTDIDKEFVETWHNPPQLKQCHRDMLSRFYRKVGSLMGLFAILMATLAPTVSQSVEASRSATALSDWHCSAQMSDPSQDGRPGTHPLADHWQACGYCNLLAHTPTVPGIHPVFATTVWAIQHRVITRFESVRRVEPFTAAQPRAPPVFS